MSDEAPAADGSPDTDKLNEIQQRRRDALRQIAMGVAYAAPTTLVAMSVQASVPSC